jgi:short-subunit dehydrogenase
MGSEAGLGASLARRFAVGGYTVALVSRKMESLLPVEQAITKEGGKALSVTADTGKACSTLCVQDCNVRGRLFITEPG